MPAILEPRNVSAWLDPDTLIAEALRCLAPYPADAMQTHPVRPLVNSVKNNGPQLIDPVEISEHLDQSEFAF